MKKTVFLLPLILGACTTTPQVVLQKTELNIPTPSISQPAPISNPHFYVINKNNFESQINKIGESEGVSNPVIIAVDPNGFNQIMKNYLTLGQYIQDQRSVIHYYQNSIDNFNKSIKDEK